MNFEWDEKKREINLDKHGIDFVDCCDLFDDKARALTFTSSLGDEPRFVTVGETPTGMTAVIWTMRGESIRIISARSARRDERKRYGEIHN